MFERWRSWVTPVSRLISQHQVESPGGAGGGLNPHHWAAQNLLCSFPCLEQEKEKKSLKRGWSGQVCVSGWEINFRGERKGMHAFEAKKKKEKRSSSGLKPCLNNTLNCRSDSQWMSQTIKPLLSYLQDRSVVWVTALYSRLRLHANIGGSLPPCGGRRHLILWWGNWARAVCKVRQNTNHLGNVKSV